MYHHRCRAGNHSPPPDVLPADAARHLGSSADRVSFIHA